MEARFNPLTIGAVRSARAIPYGHTATRWRFNPLTIGAVRSALLQALPLRGSLLRFQSPHYRGSPFGPVYNRWAGTR